MRVLLVAPFFPPHRAVASLRTHSFARAWAAAGHEVTVLTTPKREDQSGLPLPVDGFRVVEVEYRVPRLLERLRAGERSTRDAVRAMSHRRPIVAGPVYRSLRWLKRRTGIFGGVREPDLTDFWIDPAAGVGGVYATQMLPFADKESLPLFFDFERTVYEHLS